MKLFVYTDQGWKEAFRTKKPTHKDSPSDGDHVEDKGSIQQGSIIFWCSIVGRALVQVELVSDSDLSGHDLV